jgi:hypothetical protein
MSLPKSKVTASNGLKYIHELFSLPKQILAAGLIAFLLTSSTLPVFSQTQTRKISGKAKSSATKPVESSKKSIVKKTNDDIVGVPTTGEIGIPRTTEDIMASALVAAPSQRPLSKPERFKGERLKDRKQNPESKSVRSRGNPVLSSLAPQPTGISFTGATLADTGAFPPDTMGAVGPTQFVVFLNGRVRTFNKTTGVADGVINADSDVFFAPVMTPNTPGGINFTSDPNVRYDRLTSRWFLTIIDVPSTSASSIGDRPNRILIAVSDGAAGGVLSGATVWTFYFVQQDTVGGIPSNGEFLDYPSLGIDNNALYIGSNQFGAVSGSFVNSSVFVIRKSSVTAGGPVVATAFRGVLPNGSSDGPFAPRGVDNYDPAATEGYIIGVSNAAFGRLIIRRIFTPATTPTISANILLTTATTSFPITVDHLGDANGINGNLDALDDRLYAAHIRNGRLWTAHNIAVTAAGASSGSDTQRRNGVRWYELNGIRSTDNGGVPVVVQQGTIFDNAATVAAARQYWIPSVMVSGQGHAAFGYSTAGTPYRADAATNGRLRTDAANSSGAVTIYTASSTAYNPPSDPGPPRRWGDYSFTSLDPKDDMTMWTIQEFCSSTNNYGVRAVQLIAPPPPAVLTPSPASTAAGQTSVNIVVTGVSSGGSGFYDPGTDLPAPATPFTHITASITPPLAPEALTVNSVTYNSPTQVTVNLNTTGATPGVKTLTITNPDGQTTSTSITILPGPTAAQVSASGRVINAAGMGIANASVMVTTETGQRRAAMTNAFGHFRFDNLLAGQTYVFTVTAKRYTFSSPSQAINLSEDRDDVIFIANN